jgi:hypothetical protein
MYYTLSNGGLMLICFLNCGNPKKNDKSQDTRPVPPSNILEIYSKETKNFTLQLTQNNKLFHEKALGIVFNATKKVIFYMYTRILS